MEATEIINREGLEINERKTQFIKISHGFTYLQTKYNIDNGHIVTRPTHDKIVREKRKLAAAKRLVEDGIVTDYEVLNWYRSWKGGLLKDYNACWNTVQSMDKLFNDLFPEIKKPERRSRNKAIREIFKEADYEDLQYFWSGAYGETGLLERSAFTE